MADTNAKRSVEIDAHKLRAALGENFENLEAIVNKAKSVALTLIHDAKSGHCGGCMSIMEPLLLHYAISYTSDSPPAATHISGGHMAPALYALGHMFGNITKEEMGLFRTIDFSEKDEGLSGHIDTRCQGVAAGILGQGAGVANGYALAERLNAKKDGRAERKTWVFIGDGEADEGAVFEAIEHGATAGLNVAYILIHNKRNLSGALVHDFDGKMRAIKGLNMSTIETIGQLKDTGKEGCQIEKFGIETAYWLIRESSTVYAMFIDTIKGQGISFMESHPNGYHGDPLPDDLYIQAMKELGQEPTTFRTPELKSRIVVVRDTRVEAAVASLKEKGYGLTSAPTRKANDYLASLGDDDKSVVVLIPDVGKSVCMDKFQKAHPERFFDVGVKESTATLEAMGLAAAGFKPIVSTFNAFIHLIMPGLRIADYSQLPVGIINTHAEFIGEDGATHQMTEDLGAILGLFNIDVVGNPADIEQAKDMIAHCLKRDKPFYLRLGRPNVPTLYGEKTRELPQVGEIDDVYYTGFPQGSTPLRFVTIYATGQQVWESMIAAEMLKADNVATTVINVAYFKPWDEGTICQFAQPVGGRHVDIRRKIVTSEAHNPETGLASRVAYTLTKNKVEFGDFLPLGVTGYVPSGSIEAQKKYCELLGEQMYHTIKEKLRLL